MFKKYLFYKSLSLFIFFIALKSTFAAESMKSHEITTGGGISAPSGLQALGLNPAGLTFNHSFKLLGEVASPNDDFDPLGYGGRLVYGNGSLGAAASYRTFNGALAGSSQIEYAQFGLAADLKIFSLGVSGNYVLGPGATNLDWDVGALIPLGNFSHLGFFAHGLDGGPDGYGVGLTLNVAGGATLSIDVSGDQDLNGIVVMPALGVHLNDIQLSIGYGLDIDDNDGGSFLVGDELTAGVGLKLSQNIRLYGQYNLISKYVLGLAIQL